VLEVSRFVTAPGLPRDRTLRVRHRLASALMEYGLEQELSAYTLVTHMSWLPTLLCVGWTCDPLGLPQPLGTDQVGAMRIEVSEAGLAALRSFGGRYPVITPHSSAEPVVATWSTAHAV